MKKQAVLNWTQFKEHKKACASLITIWSELSRISRETASRDLKENFGTRYEVREKGSKLSFVDTEGSDKFEFNGIDWT